MEPGSLGKAISPPAEPPLQPLALNSWVSCFYFMSGGWNDGNDPKAWIVGVPRSPCAKRVVVGSWCYWQVLEPLGHGPSGRKLAQWRCMYPWGNIGIHPLLSLSLLPGHSEVNRPPWPHTCITTHGMIIVQGNRTWWPKTKPLTPWHQINHSNRK